MASNRNPSNWLPELVGPVNIEADGVAAERRRGGLNFVGATIEDDPDNDRINVTTAGGVGSGTNLGTGVEVFKDVSAGAIRHRTLIATGTAKASLTQNANEIEMHPAPPGVYNPADYGAALDGVTDDLAAFQAMHTAMPSNGGHVHMAGMAYLSDTWRISKPIRLQGIGGLQQYAAGFEVAAGKTAIQLDPATISADGNTASMSELESLCFKSKVLVHGTAGGSSLGKGLDYIWNSAAIRKGDCVIQSGGANPTKFWRCTDTGLGTSPVTLTSEPTWNTAVGATTTHQGATFVCEKFPVVRADSTAYAVGDRVWPVADNRFYFECEVAGTSAGSPPAELVGGDAAPGVQIGGTVTDGGVTWRTKIATGVLWLCNIFTMDRCFFSSFTGPGFEVSGGVGTHILGATDTNCFKVRDCRAEYCGLGCAIQGSDANGWMISGFFVIDVGVLLPTPNAAAAAGYVGLGGHGIHDRSLASGEVSHCYFQISSGRPILKNGLGRMTVLSSFQEIDSDCLFSDGYTVMIGGSCRSDANSINTIVLTDYVTGVVTKSTYAGTTFNGALAVGPKLYSLRLGSGVDTTNDLAWTYGYGVPSGWWGQQHAYQYVKNAVLLSTSRAGMDPGAGWYCFPDGFLYGNPSTETPLFRGNISMLTNSGLRSGARKTGDVFEGANTKVSVLSDGYRGVPWTANTAVAAENTTWSIPATYVEPTANTGKREGGEQVWKCTTAGTTHATTQPTWPASPTAGVTTIADGTAVWTYVGSTPAYDVEQTTQKAKLPTRLVSTQTTTGTAGQVIFDATSIDGVPFDLPPDAITVVVDVITLKKPGTASGGRIKIETVWVRDGTAAPVRLDADSPSYTLSGATLDGTTVEHVASGNKIVLQGSPESAETLNWRVFRTQMEGTDD